MWRHLILQIFFTLLYDSDYLWQSAYAYRTSRFTPRNLRRTLIMGRRGSTLVKEPLSPRIIGGSIARYGEAPYTLSLQVDNRHRCGAVLIFPSPGYQVALTSAHCAMVIYEGSDYPSWKIPPERMSLVGGVVRLSNSDRWGQRRNVTRVVFHNYNEHTRENDIAILFFNALFRTNEYVQPIELPRPGQTTTSGTLVVSGWGSWEAEGDSVDELHVVEDPVVNHDTCRNAYYSLSSDLIVSDTMICTGGHGRGACTGDSGGPAVTKWGRYLAGINSWGYDCGNPRFPSVYTDVSQYVYWIQQQVYYGYG